MEPFHWETSSLNAIFSIVCAIVALYLLIAYRYREHIRERREVFILFGINLLCWGVLNFLAQFPFLATSKLLLFEITALFWLQSGFLVLRLFNALCARKNHLFWTIWNLICIASLMITLWTGSFLIDVRPVWFGYVAARGFLYPVFILLFVVPPAIASLNVLYQAVKTSEGEALQSTRDLLLISVFAFLGSLLFDIILPYFGISSFDNTYLLGLTVILFSYYNSSNTLSRFVVSMEKAADHLFEGMEEGILLLDLDGSVLQCNSAAAQILGSTRSRLRGEIILKLLPELELGFMHRSLPMTLQLGNVTRYVSISTTILKERSMPYGSILVLRDQTELLHIRNQHAMGDHAHPLAASSLALRHAEKAIREQENYLRTLLDTLPFQIWAKNTEGICILQNRLDRETRGYQIGQLWRADSSNPREIQQAREEDKALQGEESTSKFSLTSNGVTRWYQNMLVPIQSQDSVSGIISITMDMTEQKNAELERAQFKERLLHANKMEAMGTLAGGIAHDFNNLLGAIVGFCELAEETIPTEMPARNYLREALSNADRARHLVHQMLSSTRDSDRICKEFSLHFLINESVAFLKSSIPPGVRLELSLNQTDMNIMADSSEFHRILLNLVSNSIHAMGKTGGTLKVGTRLVSQDVESLPGGDALPPGYFAMIEVADTGCGIPPDKLDRIFDPFFTTKGPQEGSGLGLSIVRTILESNQAQMRVESEPGMGTSFTIYWPIKQQRAGLPEPEAPGNRVVVVATEALLAQIQAQCQAMNVHWIHLSSLDDLTRLWTIQRWRVTLIDYDIFLSSQGNRGEGFSLLSLQAPAALVNTDTGSGVEDAQVITLSGCPGFLEKHLTTQE